MHISGGNCGNVISKRQLAELNDMLNDRADFTAYEIAWYGIGSADGYAEQNEKIMTPNNTPLDPNTKKRKIDIRVSPEVGGRV